MRTFVWIAFTMVTVFFACNRVKTVIEPQTELIFPLEIGQTRDYLVVDTTWIVGPIAVVDVYYKREIITRQDTDQLGRALFVLETFRTADTLGGLNNFEPERAGYMYRGSEFGERFLNNRRILVLKFPVAEGIAWNGNLYNPDAIHEEAYRYTSIDTTYTLAGVSYPQCVEVTKHRPDDPTSPVKARVAYEVFAPEIGRVYYFDRTVKRNGQSLDPDESYTHIETLLP